VFISDTNKERLEEHLNILNTDHQLITL